MFLVLLEDNFTMRLKGSVSVFFVVFFLATFDITQGYGRKNCSRKKRDQDYITSSGINKNRKLRIKGNRRVEIQPIGSLTCFTVKMSASNNPKLALPDWREKSLDLNEAQFDKYFTVPLGFLSLFFP
jgi:hypothetical protein